MKRKRTLLSCSAEVQVRNWSQGDWAISCVRVCVFFYIGTLIQQLVWKIIQLIPPSSVNNLPVVLPYNLIEKTLNGETFHFLRAVYFKGKLFQMITLIMNMILINAIYLLSHTSNTHKGNLVTLIINISYSRRKQTFLRNLNGSDSPCRPNRQR